MESARAWLDDGRGPTLPSEIATLLASLERTQGFEPELAIPELVTKLDAFRGEHREQLCAALFGPAPRAEQVADRARPLSYQFVTALAGALIEAQERACTQAVLTVHEFISRPDPTHGIQGTTPSKVKRNSVAFERVVRALSPSAALVPGAATDSNTLVGELHVPGTDTVPAHLPLLIGKAQRSINQRPHTSA